MSAYSIFICHTCKKATKETANNSWPFSSKDKGLIEFSKEHPAHEVSVESDAHGQFAAEDYDFKAREFDFSGLGDGS